ncbi:MAG: ATP-binding cassette domain-containing protein, partial [Actinomycetota bacterium]
MIKVIMAFGREDHEFGRFRSQGEKALDARLKLTVRQTGFSLAVNVIMASGTALVLWFGAQHVLDKQLSVGQLLIIMSYIAAVYKPLEQISRTITNLQEQLISLEASLDLMKIPPDIIDPRDGIEVDRAEGRLTFEQVDFSYQGRDETLSGVDFDVPAGSRVALVGPTGAGKSTLVSLIPRFIDPTGGRVLLDGVDVKNIRLKSLRSQISVVIQDAMLFSGTIYENIRYGRLDASRAEIMDAARAAGAHDFISSLPKGYGTMLGEGGSQLSGGERQRICIARAFLKDAPILILDEPTSAVDSKTEGVILQALNRLMEGRTTLMIAHRLATIKTADHVLVVHEGRIAQQGTRQELASAEGLYRELHAAQDLLEEAGVTADVDTAMKAAASGDAAGPSPEGKQPAPAPGPAPATAAPAVRGPRKAVVLGMIGKMPVAGLIWQTLHYLLGLQKLGYQTYYVEAHARTPTMLWESPGDDATAAAAALIGKTMTRIGLKDRWAFHALHDDGRCMGMQPSDLSKLYRDAELIINLHGGTTPTQEQAAGGRLIYIETDPVERQIQLFEGNNEAVDFLEPHAAFFTFAENYGRPGCLLPLANRFHFRPTRQPVVLSSWQQNQVAAAELFTTVGNWKQSWRDVTYRGKIYSWSKHLQFEKYLDLPGRSGQGFELALASIDANDRGKLAANGWRVRDAKWISGDLDAYRKFIRQSRGEFTVAKQQNVDFRTGWFSDRSATYLAAGRPVITEETGFSEVLSSGEGLFGVSSSQEAAAALESINSAYERHSKAAADIAREFFSHEVVLGRLLDDLGLTPPSGPRLRHRGPFPESTPLVPRSRRPLELDPQTVSQTAHLSTPAGRLAATPRPRA